LTVLLKVLSFNKEKIPVTQTKFLKVKPSLQLQTPQPSLQNTQQAFRAAQENDVVSEPFLRDCINY